MTPLVSALLGLALGLIVSRRVRIWWARWRLAESERELKAAVLGPTFAAETAIYCARLRELINHLERKP